MKFCPFLFLIFSWSLASGASFKVGQRTYTLEDVNRHLKISTYVWYPVDEGAGSVIKHAQGPFLPLTVVDNAPISKSTSKYPVVLLSHGSMGLGPRLFWLAEDLVHRGAIVIAVDHPGNKFGDTSAKGLVQVWNRAKDLSFVLDQISHDSNFKDRLNLNQVSAAGHSAGGAAVLMLVGAKFSSDQFSNPIPKCHGSNDPFYEKECKELDQVNFKSFNKSVIEGDYSDSRVKSVIALDPGFFRSFQVKSLKAIGSKTHLFIAEHLAAPQDEIFSKDFIKILPQGSTEIVPKSVHMTFLQACKGGATDPDLKDLCSDADEKIEIQKAVAEKAFEFFKRTWN